MSILWPARIVVFLGLAVAISVAEADGGNPPVINSWEYETIQDAIDQAPSPAIVLLPPGPLEIEEALRLKDGVVLDGQGMTVVSSPGDQFGLPFLTKPDAIDPALDFMVTGPQEIRVRINGALEPGHLVRVALADGDFWVSEVADVNGLDVRFQDPLPRGGHLGRLERIDPVEKAGLRNLTIEGGRNPFWIAGARDFTLENVRIEGNEFYSVIDQSYRVTIEALSKYRVSAGLAVFSSNQVVLQDALIDQHAFAGIFLRSAFNTAVQNVQIIGRPDLTPASGLTGDGITIYRGQDIRISQVQIRDTSCYGTWITESKDVSYSDVQVENSFTHAFYAVDSDGVSFVRCRSQFNRSGWGFVLVNNRNINLRHNLAQRLPMGFLLWGNQGGRWQRNLSQRNEVPDTFENNQGIIGL